MSRRVLAGIVLVVVTAGLAAAQERRATEPPKGSVSGRVLRDGKPALGIGVLVARGENPGNLNRVAQTVTGADGAYRIEALPAGAYVVTVDAPGLVVKGIARWWGNGRQLTLSGGEAAEGFDIELERGGVITGRVTNVGGRPVPGERLTLYRIAEGGTRQPAGGGATDDRGVYRVYGLAPGRYIVAAGMPDDPRMMSFGQAKRYRLTYHPAAAVESEAAVLDVVAGGEVAGADIILPRPDRLYEASGRMVYADTGEPAAGLPIMYGSVANGQYSGRYNIVGETSESGEFRLTGLKPGDYGVAAHAKEGSPYYAKPISFSIDARNVNGLVVSLERGATITGLLAVEGATPGGFTGVNALTLTVDQPEAGAGPAAISQSAKVGVSGAFTIAGVEPGRYRFLIGPWDLPVKPMIVRVERDGAPTAGTIDVRAVESTSVQITAAFGTATIQGHARIKGGAVANQSGVVMLRRADVDGAPRRCSLDSRLRFIADGLPAGSYIATLTIFQFDAGQTRRFSGEPKTVEVGDGEVREVELEVEVTDAE